MLCSMKFLIFERPDCAQKMQILLLWIWNHFVRISFVPECQSTPIKRYYLLERGPPAIRPMCTYVQLRLCIMQTNGYFSLAVDLGLINDWMKEPNLGDHSFRLTNNPYYLLHLANIIEYIKSTKALDYVTRSVLWCCFSFIMGCLTENRAKWSPLCSLILVCCTRACWLHSVQLWHLLRQNDTFWVKLGPLCIYQNVCFRGWLYDYGVNGFVL